MTDLPGAVARIWVAGWIPLGQAPSLRSLRRTGSHRRFVRDPLRYYELVRLPTVVHHGCTLILGHADHANGAWPTVGPPGFRAESFGTCMGSMTTWSPRTSRDDEVRGVAFRVQPDRRRSRLWLFRGSIPSPYLPLSTLATNPRGLTAMTRGTMWLAMPSM